MSFGIPVIVSNVGGIPEIVFPICLFESKDIKALVSLSERITHGPQLYHRASLHLCSIASNFTGNLDIDKDNFFKSFAEY